MTSVHVAPPAIFIAPVILPISVRLVVLKHARGVHVDAPPLVRLAVALAALPAARARAAEDVDPGRVAVLYRAGERHAHSTEIAPTSGLKGRGRGRGGARQEGDDEAVEEGEWGGHGERGELEVGVSFGKGGGGGGERGFLALRVEVKVGVGR